jgi:hypothetical protein
MKTRRYRTWVMRDTPWGGFVSGLTIPFDNMRTYFSAAIPVDSPHEYNFGGDMREVAY